jgi:glycosyltransferase involved in cell wall biosynthesis
MTGGSGSNLKMLEYFAAGLPVISSRYGARGLDVEDGVHLTIAETAHLPDALRQLRDEAPAMRDRRVMAARRLVEERFDWRVIADRFYEAVMARRATTDDATGLAPDRVLGGVLAEMPL